VSTDRERPVTKLSRAWSEAYDGNEWTLKRATSIQVTPLGDGREARGILYE
jgi:hypothetical protein